ncbi:hypothetical protein [uncultured Tenacibaculum sp.]|uniref:hypothetical protein n=1 Tax=uncultured Tenacibaculum sp. TaxID=174713 RepID=UPI002637DB04|nr:hypothetical protein [uncultured Tenacibaculum sp.]
MDLVIEAKRWCWAHQIKIYPHPLNTNGTKLKIIISKNGNEGLGENTYSKENVFKKINELYTTIYERQLTNQLNSNGKRTR